MEAQTPVPPEKPDTSSAAVGAQELPPPPRGVMGVHRAGGLCSSVGELGREHTGRRVPSEALGSCLPSKSQDSWGQVQRYLWPGQDLAFPFQMPPFKVRAMGRRRSIAVSSANQTAPPVSSADAVLSPSLEEARSFSYLSWSLGSKGTIAWLGGKLGPQ